MNSLEFSLYEASRLFLFPILLLIGLALTYAFVALGMFLAEAVQRAHGGPSFR
jgi:hypothetical protein